MPLPSPTRNIRVHVPATSANLGPGFDCLGLALALYTIFELEVVPPAPPAGSPPSPLPRAGDDVLACRQALQLPPLQIRSTWGEDPAIQRLPTDEQNLFYRSWISHLSTLGLPVPAVASAAMTVGLPPGRGLGSSATAVIGGILAAESYAAWPEQMSRPSRRSLPQTRKPSDLVGAAVELEHGHHADNVAAALLGGLVVAGRDERTSTWRVARLPVPSELRAVLFVPDMAMDTVAGRALLPAVYGRDDTVHNIGHTALLVAVLAGNDLSAVGAAMDDRCHEPYRVAAFPQLPELLCAARGAGALGACLSGGGSSILALSNGDQAERIARALAETASSLRVSGRALVVSIDRRGAQVYLGKGGGHRYRKSRKEAERSSGSSASIVVSAPPLRPPAEPGFRCPECGSRFPLSRLDYRCDACGEPLDLEESGAGEPSRRGLASAVAPSRDAGSGVDLRRRLDARLGSLSTVDRSGVWRFRELLLGLPPVADGSLVPVSRPEGQTNCYPAGRELYSGGHGSIGRLVGVDHLWIKHEGENPTGSFKDRGMTVAVSVARWLGATAVACASTGNTSASMAAYAAQAGLRAIVLLPDGKVASGKLSQAIAYGAEIRPISGDFDRAMAEVERICRDEGCHLLNSLNPFRVLGQQTLALELLQQLSWEAPDWIVLPAGNLGNTSALGRGLLLAYRFGLISRVPRIAAIQASGANPFFRSFQQGFADLRPVEAHTLATAINIGNPVSFRRARQVILATRGVVAEVSDQEILRAKAIVDQAGIGCELASAASVAGVLRLVNAGVIGHANRVVAILTGNLLKDPASVLPARQAYDHYRHEPVEPGAGGARG